MRRVTRGMVPWKVVRGGGGQPKVGGCASKSSSYVNWLCWTDAGLRRRLCTFL